MLTEEKRAAPVVVGSFPPINPLSPLQADTKEAVDQSLQILAAHRDEWLKVSIENRLRLLEDIREKLYSLRSEWVQMCIVERNWPQDAYHVGFEWGAFACILRGLRILHHTLRDIQKNGRPINQCVLREGANHQIVARVFPQNFYDRALFMQTTADVFMEPYQSMADVQAGWAQIYHDQNQVGRTCLVLAAGNSAQITPLILLHKLFVENEVVMLKTNPVNAYLTPYLRQVFGRLIGDGYLQIIDGGAAEGAYLCQHDGVDSVQITGSDKTFEAIVFGAGEDAQARKREKRPFLQKPIQAELGAVSPVLVVPGRWSKKDIQMQAELIASWVISNAGFNCLTPRVLLTHREWPQREALVKEIRRVFAQTPTLNAYYPGAHARYEAFQKEHPEMEQYGMGGNGRLPWGFIPAVEPANQHDICFTAESYCGVLADVPLSAPNTAQYLDQAAEFANDALWGNLSMTIIADQNALKDPQIKSAYNRALTTLRYGTIGVNFSIPLVYFSAVTPWGAYPGNTFDNIQSGIGFVNNFLMFAHPQKSIFQAPFRKMVEPVRVGSKNMVEFGRKLLDFEMNPSLRTFVQTSVAAMKS